MKLISTATCGGHAPARGTGGLSSGGQTCVRRFSRYQAEAGSPVQAHATGQLARGRLLFALDEVTNIAALEELPQIAFEGAGQGLLLLAAVRDLSQARQRGGAGRTGCPDSVRRPEAL